MDAKDADRIFNEALELTSSAERAAFLRGVCGDNQVLLKKVERLLLAHEEARSFLATEPGLRSADVPLSEAPGTMIGRYKILQRIGEGGCGVVYVAEQEEPVRRKVALKIIKLGMDTKQVIARFEAERQALAMMDHPNIARVLDAGATDTGRPYFVMELVRGIKITDYCDQGNLSTRERLDLFIPVCQAIQHAHQKGIIHRDIKPSNVLVTVTEPASAGVPKVIDFGIAKATTQQRLTDKTLYTAFEQFIGTPAYMSPEQAAMTSVDIDTRTDIYALGVLLYEMLTGKTPFEPKELFKAGLDEMRRIIREQDPVRPSTRLLTLLKGDLKRTADHRRAEPPKLINTLRGDLDWIVMKALEKDRARRYESANGLVLDIERHFKNEPVIACPPSPAYRVKKFVQRNKIPVTAAVAVFTALVLGSAGSTWQWFRADRERQRAEKNEQTALDERLKARQNAYASDLGRVAQALADNNLGYARELLYRQIPQLGQKDLCGWEWRYLWKQCQNDARHELCQLTNAAVYSLAVSHDGKLLAIGESRRGRLSIWNLQQRQVVTSLTAGQGGVCVAFSPQDSLLAFSSESDFKQDDYLFARPAQCSIQLWDKTTGQIVTNLPLAGGCIGLAFSQDGNTLVSRDSRQLTVWRVPSGRQAAAWPVERGVGKHMQGFAVNRDASLAAVGTYTLRLVDLTTGNDVWPPKPGDNLSGSALAYYTSLAFSPDGKVLVSAGGQTGTIVRFWDAASGNEIAQPLTAHRVFVGDMLFTSDGKTLVTASGDQTIRLWDVSKLPQVVPRGRPLRGHTLEIFRLALLPDDQTLVSGSKNGVVHLWNTAEAREDDPITLNLGFGRWRFSADGESILSYDAHRRVMRSQGERFQQTNVLFKTPSLNLKGACFSEDGQRFAWGSPDGHVRIWDLQTRKVIQEFKATLAWAKPWEFVNHDTKLIVLEEGGGRDRLWDLTKVQEIYSWTNPPHAFGWAVSPDDRWWLRLGREGECSIRNMVSGQVTVRQLNISEATITSLSPDGTILAVASWGNYVRLWSTSTWQELRTLRSTLLGYHSVAFSPDGSRLITSSHGHQALKFWDTDTFQDLLTLPGDSGYFYPVKFSPNGNTIGAMSSTGVLHLWRAPSMEAIEGNYDL